MKLTRRRRKHRIVAVRSRGLTFSSRRERGGQIYFHLTVRVNSFIVRGIFKISYRFCVPENYNNVQLNDSRAPATCGLILAKTRSPPFPIGPLPFHHIVDSLRISRSDDRDTSVLGDLCSLFR